MKIAQALERERNVDHRKGDEGTTAPPRPRGEIWIERARWAEREHPGWFFVGRGKYSDFFQDLNGDCIFYRVPRKNVRK